MGYVREDGKIVLGLFLFAFCKQTSIILFIFVSRMIAEESFVEKLQRQSKERLQKLRK
jgi:hypothetical protein